MQVDASSLSQLPTGHDLGPDVQSGSGVVMHIAMSIIGDVRCRLMQRTQGLVVDGVMQEARSSDLRATGYCLLVHAKHRLGML